MTSPLARPHAVPGVPDNSGFHWELAESRHQKVGATIKQLSWSGADADAQWVRPGLARRSERQDPASSGWRPRVAAP